MEVNYTERDIIIDTRPSIFLAGPTPRSKDVKSWRIEAIKILEKLNFNGIVYVPEDKFEYINEYINQVEWEKKGLTNATIIVFWIPRVLKDMPAFTTNVEFGFWIAKNPNKIVYGRPDDAEKNRYLDWLYKDQINANIFNSLENTLKYAVDLINKKTK